MTQEVSYYQPQQEKPSPQIGTRRSRMETFCDILHVLGTGSQKPTHIMYKVNLSWTAMQAYLNVLETQGLIELSNEKGKVSYKLSQKGYEALEKFKFLREHLELYS